MSYAHKPELRPVPGFPWLEVAGDGTIWRLYQDGWRPMTFDGKERPAINYKDGRGRRRLLDVHVVVCTAFHGPRPRRKMACHKDDDIHNNRPDNLYWATRRQNRLDAIRNGRIPLGSELSWSKLTEEVVSAARVAARDGVAVAELAKRYGVHRTVMGRAVRGATWKHVAEPPVASPRKSPKPRAKRTKPTGPKRNAASRKPLQSKKLGRRRGRRTAGRRKRGLSLPIEGR